MDYKPIRSITLESKCDMYEEKEIHKKDGKITNFRLLVGVVALVAVLFTFWCVVPLITQHLRFINTAEESDTTGTEFDEGM